MKNTSRFLQINSSLLLEYIINNSSNYSDNIENDIFSLNDISLIKMINDEILYFEKDNKGTNNDINHACFLYDDQNTWFISNTKTVNNDLIKDVKNFNINTNIPFDTIRIHVISGYSFKDVYGIMLQVKTPSSNNLSNWLYRRGDLNYNFEQPLIINNRIYDKFIDLKVPSIKHLSLLDKNIMTNDMKEFIGINGLNITNSINNIKLSFSYVSYDDVDTLYDNFKNPIGYIFKPENEINFELPYDSESDRFNALIKESINGNYITFCGTWDDMPITKASLIGINNRLNMYTNTSFSENAMDNMYFADLSDDVIGEDNKWLIEHELITLFYDNSGKRVLPTQRYYVQQRFNDELQQVYLNYKPIIDNNTVSLGYITFDYTVKLINNYDGTQIIRRASLTTYNTKRYIDNLKNIDVKNQIVSYNVYNKKIENNLSLKNNTNVVKTKYVKVFYNSSNIIVNDTNNFVQNINYYGDRLLFNLSTKTDNEIRYLDLSDIASYVLVFEDENNNIVEINPTYSNNMNLLNGQLEFNISANNTKLMANNNNKIFAIKCKNIDGSVSTIVEIKYNINN